MSTNAIRPAGSTDTAPPSAATARSPSLIAPASHVASLSNSTPAIAVTRPPLPRSGCNDPSAARWNVIGPRFDATTSGDSIAVAPDADRPLAPGSWAIAQSPEGAPSRAQYAGGSLAGNDSAAASSTSWRDGAAVGSAIWLVSVKPIAVGIATPAQCAQQYTVPSSVATPWPITLQP